MSDDLKKGDEFTIEVPEGTVRRVNSADAEDVDFFNVENGGYTFLYRVPRAWCRKVKKPVEPPKRGDFVWPKSSCSNGSGMIVVSAHDNYVRAIWPGCCESVVVDFAEITRIQRNTPGEIEEIEQ